MDRLNEKFVTEREARAFCKYLADLQHQAHVAELTGRWAVIDGPEPVPKVEREPASAADSC